MEENMKKIWFLRSAHGSLLPFFIKNNCIALGWDKIQEDLRHKNKQYIHNLLSKEYPDKESAINIWTSYLDKFIHKIAIGDLVLTYNPEDRTYLLGKITGDYQYLHSNKTLFLGKYWSHLRPIKWEKNTISRDSLSQATKNSLGTSLTLSEIQSEQAEEILSVLNKDDLNPSPVPEDEEENSREIEESFERLKDRIMQLDADQMEELLKQILISMGYVAERTPKGADRALDVFASKDGLGLEDPRIFVEVKHRKGKMGSKEIRQFLGSRKESDKCLYVSTGGFTKDAHYEAERSNVPLTLVDIDKLASIIERYYDNFSAEGRTLLPLKKTYLPL